MVAFDDSTTLDFSDLFRVSQMFAVADCMIRCLILYDLQFIVFIKLHRRFMDLVLVM